MCCSSGSTALEIAYKALGVAGRDVLVPTNTNYATAAAALAAGARVEFYDGGLYPDLADLRPRITERTAAVVVVHIGGYITPEIRELADACAALGVPLVEDAAHAHGASLAGTPAGAFGRVAAFSFFPSKVITTGEGGVVVTDDPELAGLAYRLRNQGESVDGELHDLPGGSWRITEIGAAVGRTQLVSLAADVERRAAVIARYADLLSDVDEVEIPHLPGRQVPSGYKAVAVLRDPAARAALRDHLAAHGVSVPKLVYATPLHRQPVFAEYAGGAFPAADAFCETHLCLPLWRGIDADQVEYVADRVRDFFR